MSWETTLWSHLSKVEVSKIPSLDSSTLQDETVTLPRNVGKQLIRHAALHPTRTFASFFFYFKLPFVCLCLSLFRLYDIISATCNLVQLATAVAVFFFYVLLTVQFVTFNNRINVTL